MIITHKTVNGRCVFCGHRVRDNQPPEWPSEIDDYEESLFQDCPGARSTLLKGFLLVWLPFVYLSTGLNPFLFCLVLGAIVFFHIIPPGDEQWVGLQEVRDEYQALIAIFPSGRRSSYLIRVDEALKPLFALRDRALRAHQTLVVQSAPEIETRINQIREKSHSCSDPDLVEMYRAQLRDLYANLQKLEQLRLFIEKFQASKKSVLASLQLLRNKLFIAEQGGDGEDSVKIIEDLQLLHDIYRRVNEGSGKSSDSPIQASAASSSLSDLEPEQDLPLPVDSSKRLADKGK